MDTLDWIALVTMGAAVLAVVAATVTGLRARRARLRADLRDEAETRVAEWHIDRVLAAADAEVEAFTASIEIVRHS